MSNSIIYIIPDFWANANSKNYQQLINAFESNNFKVVPITITWKYRVMTDYINEFFGQLIHKENDYVWIFGFSFGAMIAFISAVSINPQVLYLCSLSPYFKEDLNTMKKSWKNGIWKKRLEDFKNYSYQKIVNNINCKTFLIAGEKEHKELLKRVKLSHKDIINSELYFVRWSNHNIFHKEYMAIINKVIFY